MAAVTAPAGVSAQHQQLFHFVANSAWSDAAVLAKVQEMVLPAIERHGAIEAWIIDDTSFPKQGKHSVGVHRQYCGQLGKQANCQVVVTLSVANHGASLPIAYRLYLPREWTEDAARRKKARIPEEITFKTKPQIALEQIQAACAAGVARGGTRFNLHGKDLNRNWDAPADPRLTPENAALEKWLGGMIAAGLNNNPAR